MENLELLAMEGKSITLRDLQDAFKADPEMDINKLIKTSYHMWRGTHILYYMCGHTYVDIEAIKFLLKQSNIEKRWWYAHNPLSIASLTGNFELVRIFLEDDGIQFDDGDIKPQKFVWFKRIFNNSDRIKCELLASTHCVVKHMSKLLRENSNTHMQKLLYKYIENPDNVRSRLFLFLLFIQEGYYNIKDMNSEQRKFASISIQLPTEIQMLVCNAAFEVDKPFIKSNVIEKGLYWNKFF